MTQKQAIKYIVAYKYIKGIPDSAKQCIWTRELLNMLLSPLKVDRYYVLHLTKKWNLKLKPTN